VDILKNRPIEEQTLTSISTILIEHETARALRNTTTGSNLNLAGTSSNAQSANVNSGKHHRINGKGKHRRKPYNKKQATSDPSNITCYYCTRKGHKEIDCEVKKRATEMRQGREDKHGKSAPAHRGETGDTVVHGLTAMARVAGHTRKTDEWIIDSGATHHISPNLMDFHEYHPLEDFLQVESADSVSLATAAGSINLQLDCGMLLRVEALYVPDFGASLLSVPQFIKDGIDVSFCCHSRTAYITSEDFTEQPLGRCAPGSMSFVLLGNVSSKKGYPNSTTYRANAPPRSDLESVPRSDSAFQTDIQTWHQRLGHLILSDVRKLLPKGSYSEKETATSTACDICIKAKAKEKFQRKVPARRATKPLELIHSDCVDPSALNHCPGADTTYCILMTSAATPGYAFYARSHHQKCAQYSESSKILSSYN